MKVITVFKLSNFDFFQGVKQKVSQKQKAQKRERDEASGSSSSRSSPPAQMPKLDRKRSPPPAANQDKEEVGRSLHMQKFISPLVITHDSVGNSEHLQGFSPYVMTSCLAHAQFIAHV